MRSQPWQGSTFTIRLPAARESLRRSAVREAAAAGRKARILVIDDEENVRQVLAEALMAQGHTVAAYPDARAGIAGFHEQPFDVVFTDLGMPGLSGWEVARIVKLRRPETGVVLVTGWSDQIDTAEAQWRGVDFVVAKPFEVEEIRAVVGQRPRPRAALKRRDHFLRRWPSRPRSQRYSRSPRRLATQRERTKSRSLSRLT